jgi:hypothetical protein
MHFFLFLVSYALNPFIILMVPDQSADQFLTIYATCSIVFSLYFTFLFSQKKLLRIGKLLILVVILLIVLAALITGNIFILWIAYPFSLLAGDYVCTQSGSTRYTLVFRGILILSAFPLLIFSDLFSELLLLRILVCMAFMLYILFSVKEFLLLTIESTTKWISVTYIFYSGSLLLVPIIGGEGDHIKIWFVTMQIGLGLILKKLDFSVRAVQDKAKILLNLVDLGTLCLPILVMFFYPDWILLSVYLISYFALRQLDPKEKKHIEAEV